MDTITVKAVVETYEFRRYHWRDTQDWVDEAIYPPTIKLVLDTKDLRSWAGSDDPNEVFDALEDFLEDGAVCVTLARIAEET